ncbi:hypothetical protein J6590_091843, partial [Homalodisca vitripennis]
LNHLIVIEQVNVRAPDISNSCRQERALITESDDSEGDGGVSVNYCIEGEGGTLPETPSVIRYT